MNSPWFHAIRQVRRVQKQLHDANFFHTSVIQVSNTWKIITGGVGYKRQHKPSHCRLLSKFSVKIASIVAYLPNFLITNTPCNEEIITIVERGCIPRITAIRLRAFEDVK